MSRDLLTGALLEAHDKLMINQNPAPRTALPDDAWGPDTQRILARQDDSHDGMTPDEYSTLLAAALATPAS